MAKECGGLSAAPSSFPSRAVSAAPTLSQLRLLGLRVPKLFFLGGAEGVDLFPKKSETAYSLAFRIKIANSGLLTGGSFRLRNEFRRETRLSETAWEKFSNSLGSPEMVWDRLRRM